MRTRWAVLGDRWGVTDEEVALHYPCDDVLTGVPAWRGVTVRATRAEVWPWVRQVRLAPYSYDWVDNLGRQSPRELRDLPDPQPGDAFTSIGGRFSAGEVLSVVPGEHLTARIMGAVLSYVLLPHPDGTRLLMKLVTPRRPWAGPLVLGDLPMARRQLLNWKALAEG